MNALLEFIFILQREKISFSLGCHRDAIMVVIPMPSKYYEVEFFDDGHIEVQTFGPVSDVTRMTLEDIARIVVDDVHGA